MKTSITIGLVSAGVLSLLFALSGCNKTDETATPSPGKPPEVAVVVIAPQRLALTTELSGRTASYRIAEVRPQVGGIIQQRLFTEGSDVQKGQILYQIDPAIYQSAYLSAKATLSKAEANLFPARLKLARFKDLVQINAVSKQDYDDVEAALKQAEAEVEGAKAAVETARINLDYTRVTAPISGRIGRSAVTTGALVTASQSDPLATIQLLDPVYVDVTQSTAELLRWKRDIANGLLNTHGTEQAEVNLLLEDGTAYDCQGTLKFSEVTVNQSTGSVTLRSVFPNPKQLLLPGMFVRAVIKQGVNEQAILVPQQGVTRNQTGAATALVVGNDEKVEMRMIKIVRAIGDKWLVSEGLEPGDRLIVEGLQRAQPGTQVTAMTFGSTPAEKPAATAGLPTVAKR